MQEDGRYEPRDRVAVYTWINGVRLHGVTGTVVEVTVTMTRSPATECCSTHQAALSPVHDFLPSDLLEVGHLFDPLRDAADEGSQP